MYYEEENRTERIILVAAIGMGVAAIVIFCLAVFIIVDPLGTRKPPPSPTATRTPTAPLPTWTFTPTRTIAPTRTPVPTNTPTPIPTNTPVPTNTRAPTRRPPPPTPLPYVDAGGAKGHSCTQMGFQGWVKGPDGFPIPGVAVRMWSDRGHDFMRWTNDAGHYELFITPLVVDYQTWWHVQIIENGVPGSGQVNLPITLDCVNDYQMYEVNWRRIR